MPKIPLVLVTGYLGAGKTTLLRNVLSRAEGRRIAVLMNEFGEIGIDGSVVSGENMDMVEMEGGCVCCSITGELEAALEEVVERVDPEMIVLETTGVAEPDAIIGLVQTGTENVGIDSVVTVVDCDALARTPSLGHTGRIQIKMADVVLLNKMDLVEEEEADEVEELVKELNPDVEIYRTVEADVDWELLLGLYEPKEIEHGEHELETENFSLTPGEMGLEEFREFAENLPEEVYRAKGFVELDGDMHLFNYVAGRYTIEEWEDEAEPILVFIGRDVKDRMDEIRERLEG